MMRFKINFKNLKQSINDYKRSCNDTLENISTINSYLRNTDSGWNDSKTYGYLQTIKMHKYKIKNYFYDLNNLFNEIDAFKRKFNQLSYKYFNKKDFNIITYDESKIDNCINKLNDVLTYLSNAQYYINNYQYNDKFNEIYKLRSLRNTINYMINDVNNILNKLKNLKREVNIIINDTRGRINKKSNIELDIKPLEYQWKVNNS